MTSQTLSDELSPPESSGQWLTRARQGDEVALELLVEEYAPRILRFSRKLCRDEQDAQEIVQQTLLSVASRIGQFRGESSFSSWLYSIARSHCIKLRTRGDAARSIESLEDHERELASAGGQAPDERLARGELETALQAALAALEPQQREVLLLRDVEGLSAPEVARALGLTVEAVKSRLHRARKALQSRLGPWLEQNTASPACPDVVELLSRHQEGDVTPGVCREMEAHVDQCPDCAKRCHSLRHTLSLCNASPLPVLSPELKAVVQAQIRRSLGRQRGPLEPQD
ncbi:MAG TPA: sigma-70 family RNA polymerase sigma factor [Polyangiaceae bacterium]|jgi:RNA polymerase sigma-70 factor (ECF subfamily)|nr:sigma-70 family RNA polymerase sigma factor [Polyangiaceae bacterium]